MIVPENVYHEYHELLEDIQNIVCSIKIDMKNASQRQLWGRTIAACDCLDDAYDSIMEFDSIVNTSYYARRPILYYYGILQTFSIQVNALNQIREFFLGEACCNDYKKLHKKIENQKENKENVVSLRNDIVHSCERKGIESCFIAKQVGMPKDVLWYGRYDSDGKFSELNINLGEYCLNQMQNVCQQLKIFLSIPKEQIYFYTFYAANK